MKYHSSNSDFCWICWPRGWRTLVNWYRISSSKGKKNISWTQCSVIQFGDWMFLGLRVWGSAVYISLILLFWFWGSQQCGWSLTVCDMCLGAMSRIAEFQMLMYWWEACLLLGWLALQVSLMPFCKNALSRPVLWLHHLSHVCTGVGYCSYLNHYCTLKVTVHNNTFFWFFTLSLITKTSHRQKQRRRNTDVVMLLLLSPQQCLHTAIFPHEQYAIHTKVLNILKKKSHTLF